MEETTHSWSANSFTCAYLFRKVYTLTMLIFIIGVLPLSSNLAYSNSLSDFSSKVDLDFNCDPYDSKLEYNLPPVEICNNGIDDDGDMLVDCADPDCYLEEIASTDVPKTISSSSATTITSIINISESGTIEDINLKNLDISHTWIDDVIVSLNSPANTTVVLLNQPCNGENNIYMTLDDEASTGSFPCPPTNGQSYIPSNALSAFDGEEMNGIWTLSVQDVYGPDDGGSLDGWTLEITKECVNVEICDNGIDDDGDMLVDCADPDCSGNSACLGCNIVSNPEFDNGTTSWTLNNNSTAASTLSLDNTSQLSGTNSAFIDVTSATGTEWHIQFLSGPYTIDATKTYNISFEAKATANKDIVVSAQQSDSPYTTYYWSPDISITTTAQTYTLPNITMSASASDALLKFYFGNDVNDIWIDNIVFEEVGCTTSNVEICDNGIDDDGDMLVDCDDPDCTGNSTCVDCNLLGNTDFNQGNSYWFLSETSPATGTWSVDNTGQLSGANSAFIDVTNSTGILWNLQFRAGALTIDNSKTYNISFEAKATGNKVIDISIQQNQSPYTTFYTESDIMVSTAAQTFTFPNVTVSASANDALFKFHLGSDSNDIWIDNIVFEEVGCTPPSTGFDNEVCYFISDGVQSGSSIPDTFYTFNYVTSAVQAIGPTLTEGIEAMAMDTVNEIIYVVDYDEFGMINLANGAFTSIKSDIGTVNGAEGVLNIDDVDGMTFDHSNNIIWATERRDDYLNNDGAPDDLLFQIDPITGSPIADAFGSGVDYVVVSTPENDLDDIAIANDGTLYAISNYGGSGNQAFGTINKTTGAWTEMGDYGVEDVESLAFTATGQLVATTGKDGANKNQLYTIDAGTGIATYVGSVAPANDVEACDCISARLTNLQIGDKVWADLDSDGLQGISEPGVSGVVVNLLTNTGSPYLNDLGNPTTTTTDALGNYLFDELPEGQYIVEFVLSGGTSFSPQNVGSDDELDSDANTSTGRTAVLTLANSTNDLSIDAGILNTNLVEICENGVDDDGDGLTDCEDIDCGMVLNREFDNGTANWNLYNFGGNSSSFSIDNGGVLSGTNSARINITNAGGSDDDTQFEQSNFSIDNGKTYRIYFDSRASDSRQIEVVVKQSNSPFTEFFAQNLQVTKFDGIYIYEFTATATEANIDLTFNLGQTTGTVWLDKIQFKEVCPDPTCILPTSDTYDICSNEVLSNSVATNDTIHEESFNNSYQITSPPTKGNVVLAEDGSFVYTPNSSAVGADQFTYERCYSFKNSLGLSNVILNPCGNGKIVETFIEGIEGESSPSLLISNPGDLTKVIVEVWAQEACGSVTIEGTLAEETDVFKTNGSLDTEKLYRVELTTVSGDGLIQISNTGSCTLSSAVAYVEREQSNGQGFSSVIQSNTEINKGQVVGSDCHVINMPIGTSDAARDITFTIPIHEKDNSRVVDVSIIAGSITGTGTTSTWTAIGEGAGEVIVTLNNIPGDVQVANIEVCSPSDNNGDSFGVGLISSYNLSCEGETTFDCCSETTADINITGASISNSSPTNCYGNGNATLIASDNASSASYSYAWSHSSETTAQVNVNPTTTTSYVVTVTNAEGCISTAETTVEVYPEIILNISNSGTDCLEFNTQLTANASGGGAGFNYVWSGPSGFSETTAIVDIAESGLYSVTVTDANGCTREATETVLPSFDPTISTTNSEICVGNSSDISISGTGITAYQWSANTGGATSSFVTVSPTTTTAYNVTVTDNQGCTAVKSATIVVIDLPIVSVTGPTSICEGFTSQLSPTSGGTWTSNNTAIAVVTNGGVVTGVSPGSTTFVFTNSTTGCASDGTLPITVNEIPVVDITGSTLLCVGSTTTLTPMSGGTWSSSNTSVATVTNVGIVTAVGAGTATFTFTSSQGCVSAPTGTVTVDPGGNTTITGDDIICEGTTTQLTASTGGGTWISDNTSIATVNSSGLVTAVSAGSVTITYDKSSQSCQADATFGMVILGAPTVTITGSTTLCVGENSQLSTNGAGGFWTSSDTGVAIISSDGTVAGIGSGTVSFTYTNSDGCESSASGVITVDPAVDVAIDFNGSLCLEDDSQLSALVTGGTAGFTYSWTGPSGFVGNTQTVDITVNGNYNLTVTDSKGCSSNTTAFVYEQYEPFIFTLNSEVCEGEDVTLSVNGASGGTYQWDANAGSATTSSVTVTPGLPSTSYTVTVTNSIGCTTSATAVIDVIAKPTVTVTGPNSICVGGTSQLSPSSGGIWSSSNYAIANVSNTGLVTGTGSGSVTFTFNDTITGCYSDPTASITVTDNAAVTITGDDQICMSDNPTLTASASGGSWSSSNTAIATIHASTGVVTPVSQGAATITYIPPASNCFSNGTYNINIYDDPVLSLNGPSTICEGSVTYVSASTSGTWTSSDVNVVIVSAAGEVSGVGAGVATLSFVSAVGCTATLGTPITVIANPVVSLTGPGDICIGATTTLSPTSGGVWISNNNAVASVNNSGIVTGISAGVASFTFIEATNGCISENNISVTVSAPPIISSPSSNMLCIGETASITPSTGGFWASSNPSVASITNDGTITAISNGSVTFMFTSSGTGCTSAASSPVTVQPKPIINFSGPTSICKNEMTSILPNTGGIWSSTDVSIATITNQGIITGVSPGNVQFIFTNTNSGCVSDSSNVLTVIQPAIVDVTGPTDICIGQTTTLSPNSGGTWTSSNVSVATVTSGGIVTGISPGIVEFTFLNGSGCSSEPTEDITVSTGPTITYTGSSLICVGSTTTLTPSSGGTWTSSNPAVVTITNSGVATAISLGTVTLTFTESTTGCSASAATDLTVDNPPVISISGNDEICIGGTTNMLPSTGGIWISNDNSVASISANGTVTGLSAGTVTFTYIESTTGCTSEDSGPVTVMPKPVVNIAGSNTICVGSTTTLSPSTGGFWTSDNVSVATVTNSGVVTGVSQGLARFTFTSTQGCASNETAPVIVFDKPNVLINGPNSICIGSTAQMLPSSGGTWQSENPTIASIDNSGLVTGLTSGVATFIFTDSNTGCVSGSSDPITVEAKPTTSLTGPSAICIGSTTFMTPSTGGIWTTLNPLVASIQNNGEIVGIGAGEAKFIFMNLTSGCYSDTTSAITVVAGPAIAFNGPTELCPGDTTYITPSTGGTWTSTNTSVATITNGGMIIGIGAGTAKFQFTETSSNCQSELSELLTVNSIPAVGVNGPSIICISSTTNLTPSSGGTWTSLNPAIAGVDASGLVTGLTEGTAYFVFTDAYTGCVSDGSLSIEVQSAPTIEITGSNSICMGYTTTLSPATTGLWISSNPAIATVSNSGIVTGHAPGVVTFQFMDPVTGCVAAGSSDPVTITNCINHDFNVTIKDETITGDLNTNDKINNNAVYGSSVETISKPLASVPVLVVNADGTYSFEANKAGKYIFRVPICLPPILLGCEGTLLEINVIENVYAQSNPVANLEFTTTYTGAMSTDPGDMVVIAATANDTCVYSGTCLLDESTISVLGAPSNGMVAINANFEIEYTPDPNFIGLDTIDYSVCMSDGVTCSQSQQIIIVNDISALNSTVANDDFYFTLRETTISGNVMQNDYDPEGDQIAAVAAGTAINPIMIPEGSYYITSAGAFSFTPGEDFTGTVNIEYSICDNNSEPYCTNATIHLLVLDDVSLQIRVYLEGALMNNAGAETQGGLPLMRDDLRVSPFTGENFIPVSDPYTYNNDQFIDTQNKFTQVGPGSLSKYQFITDSLTVFGVAGDDAIVDWVHVEIRSKTDNTVVLGTRSGLVQRDGDVVELDGVSRLRFQGIYADSIYVVVKHRSHLGVMSELQSNEEIFDFTDPNFPVFNFGTAYGNGLDYTGLSRKNSVAYGFSALWAGDFDSNGTVKFTNPNDDQNILFLGVLFSSPDFLINYDNAYGYFTSDFDMNSKSKYTNPKDDLNLLFSQILLYPLNSSFLSNFSSLIEQIPE